MITVVCTGGEKPPSSLSLAWINACQRTIAADGGLELLRSLGKKANLWIGDGDSLRGPLSSWSEWFEEARVLDTVKDDSDTEAAVRAALDGGASEVWLIGGAGGRMDHWWSNVRLLANRPQVTRWLTGCEEAWNLTQGSRLDVSVGTVSIFPLGEGPWTIRSVGLRWPVDSVDFRRWHSLSNEVVHPGGSVTVDSGQFLVLRPRGVP